MFGGWSSATPGISSVGEAASFPRATEFAPPWNVVSCSFVVKRSRVRSVSIRGSFLRFQFEHDHEHEYEYDQAKSVRTGETLWTVVPVVREKSVFTARVSSSPS